MTLPIYDIEIKRYSAGWRVTYLTVWAMAFKAGLADGLTLDQVHAAALADGLRVLYVPGV